MHVLWLGAYTPRGRFASSVARFGKQVYPPHHGPRCHFFQARQHGGPFLCPDMTLIPSSSGPSLTVMVGAPASGKSTLAAELWPEALVSVDQYRDGYDQAATAAAFTQAYRVTDRMLADGHPVVFDSTGSTRRVRLSLLRIAHRAAVPAYLVIMDTPLATCIERNVERDDPCPEKIVGEIHARIEGDFPRGFAGESWSAVVRVTPEKAARLMARVVA